MKKNRGFTLIEILVAVTLVAILSVVGVVSYTSVSRRSRDARRRNDLEQLRSALEMYRADYGYYPTVNTSDFLTISNLSNSLVTPGYMPALPVAPSSGEDYYFKATNAIAGNYYGYCVCSKLESGSANNSCTAETLPATCNYGVKHP